MAVKPKPVFIIAAIAVAAAGVASIFLYNYLKTQEEMLQGAVETTEVMIADKEIPVGTTIVPAYIKAIPWPKIGVPEGAISKSEDVVGRTPMVTIYRGDPVTELKLVPREGSRSVISHRISKGHRAISVSVDKVSGVAGFLSPGNLVDVIVVLKPESYKEAVSRIVLQNIVVLATGKVIEKKPGGEPEEVPTVTLEVTPKDAETLALANSQGRLQLILRRAGDVEEVRTRGVSVKKVITEEARKTVEGAREGARVNVEILRSNKKTVETFGREGGL